MAIKDVRKVYNQICDQYKEMVRDIQDLEVEAQNGLVEPERIDRLKEQIEPIKRNYERWTYMMFLLNQPARKEKVKKYKRQNGKLLNSLSNSNSIESVLEENKESLSKIGE